MQIFGYNTLGSPLEVGRCSKNPNQTSLAERLEALDILVRGPLPIHIMPLELQEFLQLGRIM